MSLADPLSLKHRVLNAGVWSLGGYGFSQIIRFGSNLILTRLLIPEMFGVVAIAMLVIVGLAMLSDFGLKQSIIQSKRGSDPSFLNTAWVIQIIRGIVLWLLTLSIALIVVVINHIGLVPHGSVYADPILPIVISILSFTTLIAGLQSTKLFEASRNLSLNYVTKNEVCAQIAGVVCMILWASLDRSIWCLIAGNILSLVITTILSHTSLPGVSNRWQWDRGAASEIVKFGKWIMVSSILGFLVNNGDRLLLGGLVDPALLGVYIIAFSIFNSLDQVVTKIIGDLAFPALSEVIRKRPGEMKRSYYRFSAIIAPFTYFCAGALMIAGPTLIALLYDSRYQQAGWMLQYLGVALLTIPFRLAAISLLALGRSGQFSKIIAIRLVALFVLGPLGFYCYGFPGALVGIVTSYFSILPTVIFYSVKQDLFDLQKESLFLMAVAGGALFGQGLRWVAGP